MASIAAARSRAAWSGTCWRSTRSGWWCRCAVTTTGRADHRAERRGEHALGIERVELHLRGDGTGDPEVYVRAIEAVARARRAGIPVLVHCAAGTRRAGAVTALYLLLVEGRSAAEAWRELSRFGADTLPDSPLVPFLNHNLRAIAAGLVLRGVIERVPEPLPILGPPA